jgi:hypothetical protein
VFNIDYVPSGVFNIDYMPSRMFNIDYVSSRVFTVDYVTSLGVLNIDYVPSGVFTIDYVTSLGTFNIDYVPSGLLNIDYVLRFFLLSTEFQVDLLGNHLQSDVSEFHKIIFYTNTCSKVQGVKSATPLVIVGCVYAKKI